MIDISLVRCPVGPTVPRIAAGCQWAIGAHGEKIGAAAGIA
ncbi:hypothetical protein [Cereibacter sediminicola]|nr:hypothetical protein [Cereibacter sediminicola]